MRVTVQLRSWVLFKSDYDSRFFLLYTTPIFYSHWQIPDMTVYKTAETDGTFNYYFTVATIFIERHLYYF